MQSVELNRMHVHVTMFVSECLYHHQTGQIEMQIVTFMLKCPPVLKSFLASQQMEAETCTPILMQEFPHQM